MAEILPFRGWRYNPQVPAEEVISPLFDVVSQQELNELYKNRVNSIHLALPGSSEKAGEILRRWKADHVLLQEEEPAIYVLYQRYKVPGSNEIRTGKGFIAMIRCYDWEEEVVLQHENVMSFSVEDRLNNLRETMMNVSPTHGLYTDEEKSLEPLMDEAMSGPVVTAVDEGGVENSLAIITEKDKLARFSEVLNNRQVILADGHHRYNASLLYKKEVAASLQKPALSDYHCMYLTNTETGDVCINPTHRLLKGTEFTDISSVLNELKQYFNVIEMKTPEKVHEQLQGKKFSFGMLLKNRSFYLEFYPEKIKDILWEFPEVIKNLDLTILHYFIIEKVMGISGKDQKESKKIDFCPDFNETVRRVWNGDADIGLLTNKVSMDEIKKVCYSGYTLPQKSTFFYPKVVTGFVFASLNDI